MTLDVMEAYCACCGAYLQRRKWLEQPVGYASSGYCFQCHADCDEDSQVGMVGHGCVPSHPGDGPGCLPEFDAHAPGCAKLSAIQAGVKDQ